MKKLSLIILVVLVMCLALAACNSTEATTVTARWGNETHVYNISKAVLTNPTQTIYNETYYFEPIIGTAEINPDALDQLVPEDLAGTYTVNIKVTADDSQCTYSTEQILYSLYSAELINSFDAQLQKGLQRLTIAPDSEENPFTDTANFVTLKSVTKTEVTFKNDSSQRPYSSKYSVDGFYFGKIQKEISKVNISTVYEWTAKNGVSAKVNGEEREIKGSYASGKFIDANQLLLYTRSLEKTNGKFNDRPSVTVYSPVSDTLGTASFSSFTYQLNTVINNNGTDCFVKLNGLAITFANQVLMFQMNLPDTVNKVNGVDIISRGAVTYNRYTTVRFRAGIYRYELAEYSPEIISALTSANSK